MLSRQQLKERYAYDPQARLRILMDKMNFNLTKAEEIGTKWVTLAALQVEKDEVKELFIQELMRLGYDVRLTPDFVNFTNDTWEEIKHDQPLMFWSMKSLKEGHFLVKLR